MFNLSGSNVFRVTKHLFYPIISNKFIYLHTRLSLLPDFTAPGSLGAKNGGWAQAPPKIIYREVPSSVDLPIQDIGFKI